MRKSKSWAPSRSGAACADTAEGCDGCCCDVDTPGADDSCAVDDNKLSCSVASKHLGHGFIGLTMIRGIFVIKGELFFVYFECNFRPRQALKLGALSRSHVVVHVKRIQMSDPPEGVAHT